MAYELDRIYGLPQEYGEEGEVNRVARNMEYGQRLQKLVDPNNYLSCVSREIDQNNAYPVFYSNHNQHLNIAGMREVVQSLVSKPDDMYVAIAWSLVNGGQDGRIVDFAKALVPTLEKDNMHLVPLARPVDISQLREEKKFAEAKTALKATRHNLGLLEETLDESAGLVVFPEATTARAVKDKKGKRPGLGRAEGNFVRDIHVRAKEKGRKVIHVPIGMVDTNRIIEPRQSNPHMRAKFEIGKQMIVERFGLDMNVITPIAKIVVGEPFYLNDPDLYDVAEYNDLMMALVASMLKESDRGVFRNEEGHELKENMPHVLGLEY